MRRAAPLLLVLPVAAAFSASAQAPQGSDPRFEKALAGAEELCAAPDFDAPALLGEGRLEGSVLQVLEQEGREAFERFFICQARSEASPQPCESLKKAPGWERSYAACRREYAHAALFKDPRLPAAQAHCLDYLSYSGSPIARSEHPAVCKAYLQALPGKDFRGFCGGLVRKGLLPAASQADCATATAKAAAASADSLGSCAALRRKASAAFCARCRMELKKLQARQKADLKKRATGETSQETVKKAASLEAVKKMERLEAERAAKAGARKEGWVKKESGRRRFKTGQPMKGALDLGDILKKAHPPEGK